MCRTVDLVSDPHPAVTLHLRLRHGGDGGRGVVLDDGGGHVLGDGEGAGEAGGPDAGHSHPAPAQVEGDAVVLVLRGWSEAGVSSNEPGGVEERVEGLDVREEAGHALRRHCPVRLRERSATSLEQL